MRAIFGVVLSTQNFVQGVQAQQMQDTGGAAAAFLADPSWAVDEVIAPECQLTEVEKKSTGDFIELVIGKGNEGGFLSAASNGYMALTPATSFACKARDELDKAPNMSDNAPDMSKGSDCYKACTISTWWNSNFSSNSATPRCNIPRAIKDFYLKINGHAKNYSGDPVDQDTFSEASNFQHRILPKVQTCLLLRILHGKGIPKS